jgi:hypothetical protein
MLHTFSESKSKPITLKPNIYITTHLRVKIVPVSDKNTHSPALGLTQPHLF